MAIKVPFLDITLHETYNKYYLGIVDISDYPPSWTITNASLEITPPGYNKISVPVTARGVNLYKSSQLGLTCDEDGEDLMPLPDGVYTVKFSIHPNSTYLTEKSFMRIAGILCQYGEAYLKVDLAHHCSCADKSRDKAYLSSVRMLIEGAVAEVNNCNTEKGYKYYAKAKQMLDNFGKTGCCN